MAEKRRFAMISPACMHSDSGMTKHDLQVYLALCLHRDRQSGECHPSLDLLSEMTGLPKSEISRSTTRLQKAGWIKKSRCGWKGRARYTVNLFPDLPETYNSDLYESGNSDLYESGKSQYEQTREQTREQNKCLATSAKPPFDPRQIDLDGLVEREAWKDVCDAMEQAGTPLSYEHARTILGRCRKWRAAGFTDYEIDEAIGRQIVHDWHLPLTPFKTTTRGSK